VSYEVEATGELWPIGKKPRSQKKTYPVLRGSTHPPSASMLAGAVRNELGGIEVGCKYCCDTEFGCDDCVPKDLVAMLPERRDLVEGSIQLPHVSWIAECPRSDY